MNTVFAMLFALVSTGPNVYVQLEDFPAIPMTANECLERSKEPLFYLEEAVRDFEIGTPIGVLCFPDQRITYGVPEELA